MKTLFLSISVLSAVGCGSRDAGNPSDSADTNKPELETVRFLVGANGIIDKAIYDGRLPAIVFDKQTPFDLNISEVQPAEAKAASAGLKPGTYATYIFPLSIGTSWRFSDASVHVERPLAVKGQFQLTHIKFIGSLRVSGTTVSKGGHLQMNGAPYRLFTASLDATWSGVVQNNAPADPNSPGELNKTK